MEQPMMIERVEEEEGEDGALLRVVGMVVTSYWRGSDKEERR